MPPRATAPTHRRASASAIAKPARRHTARTAAAQDVVFRATIAERGPSGLWPHVFLPARASTWLGTRASVRLLVHVGGACFRRAAKPDGDGGHYLLFNSEMRERTGFEAGDTVTIGLERDRSPATPEAPRDLSQRLHADRDADRAFAAMPPSHRRAYIEFVEEAKRPETRARRMEQALRMMKQWAEERATTAKRTRTKRTTRATR